MDDRLLDNLGLLRDAFIARQTRAAVMEVDVLVPPSTLIMGDHDEEEEEEAEEEEEREAEEVAAAAAGPSWEDLGTRKLQEQDGEPTKRDWVDTAAGYVQEQSPGLGGRRSQSHARSSGGLKSVSVSMNGNISKTRFEDTASAMPPGLPLPQPWEQQQQHTGAVAGKGAVLTPAELLCGSASNGGRPSGRGSDEVSEVDPAGHMIDFYAESLVAKDGGNKADVLDRKGSKADFLKLDRLDSKHQLAAAANGGKGSVVATGQNGYALAVGPQHHQAKPGTAATRGGRAGGNGGGSARSKKKKSLLNAPTFREMHDKGQLSVEAAALIEAGLTELTEAAAASAAAAPGAGHGGGNGAAATAVSEGNPKGTGDGSSGGGLKLRLNLWRSEMLCGVLEVDGQGEVVSVAHSQLHPAGLIFGMATAGLTKTKLGRLVSLPPSASMPVKSAAGTGTGGAGTTGGGSGGGAVTPAHLFEMAAVVASPAETSSPGDLRSSSGQLLSPRGDAASKLPAVRGALKSRAKQVKVRCDVSRL